jgi:hypothetical protein
MINISLSHDATVRHALAVLDKDDLADFVEDRIKLRIAEVVLQVETGRSLEWYLAALSDDQGNLSSDPEQVLDMLERLEDDLDDLDRDIDRLTRELEPDEGI